MASDLDKRLKELGLVTKDPPPPPPLPQSTSAVRKNGKKVALVSQSDLEAMLEKEREHTQQIVTEATKKAFENWTLSFSGKLEHSVQLANYTAETMHKMELAVQGLYVAIGKSATTSEVGVEELKGEIKKVKEQLEAAQQVQIPLPPGPPPAPVAEQIQGPGWFGTSARGGNNNTNGRQQGPNTRRRRLNPNHPYRAPAWSSAGKRFRRF